MKSYEFCGSIALIPGTFWPHSISCASPQGQGRPLPSTVARTCTCTNIYIHMRAWFHRNKWACICSSHSIFYPGHQGLLSVYHQLVRPCGQTGESDRRQGHLRPPESYKIRNSSKIERLGCESEQLGVTYRSWYSVDRERITYAKFVKIKD